MKTLIVFHRQVQYKAQTLLFFESPVSKSYLSSHDSHCSTGSGDLELFGFPCDWLHFPIASILPPNTGAYFNISPTPFPNSTRIVAGICLKAAEYFGVTNHTNEAGREESLLYIQQISPLETL